MEREGEARIICEDQECKTLSGEKIQSKQPNDEKANVDIFCVKGGKKLNNVNKAVEKLDLKTKVMNVNEKSNKKVKAQWRQVSRIFDRLFLFISVLVFISINLFVFCVAN